MASIGYYSATLEWIHKCGGTLIDSEHVLTAAHCVQGNGVDWRIKLGDFDLQNPDDDEEVMERELKKRIIHPKNKRQQAYYDIAIVEIDPVELNPAIRTICMPSEPYSSIDIYDGDAAAVIGWGSYNSSEVTAPKLKTATVSIFDYDYCNDTHASVGKFMQGTVEEYLPKLFQPHILCAGNQATKQGSCSGDSGGPLMIFDTNTNIYVQIGIVAGGINLNDCGNTNFPGVYTRLDHPEILNFIHTHAVQQVATKDLDCIWSDFEDWSPCSATCGYGMKERKKSLLSDYDEEIPRSLETTCLAQQPIETRKCIQKKCPALEACQWSKFGNWSRCSASCGNGIQVRRRILVNDSIVSGSTCDTEEAMERRPCNMADCQPEWSDWSAFSVCTKSCGKGFQTRTRVCTAKDPTLGCVGPHRQNFSCNSHICTLALWTEWSSYGACSTTCGGGTQTRSRSCPDSTCDGQRTQSQACENQECSTDENPAPTLAPNPTGVPCKDTNVDCTYWAKIGECEVNPAYMLTGCPLSCKQCTCNDCENDCADLNQEPISPASTLAPNTTGVPCKDTNVDCDFWAKNGECEINPGYMLTGCPLSCKQCTTSTLASNLTGVPCKQCKDTNVHCAYWAKIGECEVNPGYMLKGCPLSCKQCTCNDYENDCADLNESCNTWADIGECSKNPDYMHSHCAKSCNTCDNAGGN